MKRRASYNRGERGFLSIMFALTAVVLIGFTGLAIDVGYMQWEKRRIQAAADAAAMGGLRELELSQTSLIATAGLNDAALNGFTNGQNDTTVTLNNPPTSGSYSGDNLAVEAVVTRNVPTFFMRVFGQTGISISARAVAKTSGTTSQGAIGSCIFALNPTAKSAFKLDGSQSNMYVYTSCSITDESNNNDAYTQGSNADLYVGNAQIGVVGNWTLNGGSNIYSGTSGSTKYNGPKHVTSPGDPFSKLADPSTAGLTIQSANTVSLTNGASQTFNPGVYCGGISVTNGATANFNPGFYVLAGGKTLSANGGTITGSAVTFYVTSGNAGGCTGGGNPQQVGITGGTTTLSAPTSGTYEGMLIFEDRNCNSCSGANIAGNGSSSFDGALYFKNNNLKFAGNNSTNGYMVLVADTIELMGASKFGNNYSTLAPGGNFPFAPLATGGGLVQ